MENPIVYSPVDAGKIISDTAANLMKSAATSGWAKVKKYFKDFSAEESIEIGTAFNDYIRVTQERNSKIKTLIYRRVPKDIYSFYECVENWKEDSCNGNGWHRKINFNEAPVP